MAHLKIGQTRPSSGSPVRGSLFASSTSSSADHSRTTVSTADSSETLGILRPQAAVLPLGLVHQHAGQRGDLGGVEVVEGALRRDWEISRSFSP